MKYRINFDFTTVTPKGKFHGKTGSIDLECNATVEDLWKDKQAWDFEIAREMQKEYKRDMVFMLNITEIIPV